MRKTHLYTLLCVLCFPSLVCAQQAVFDEFRKAAGDYAALYSGKAEENYNQQKYLNHPYWNTDEFREGAVCYGRWLYSDLQLRYDTYKKSLIVVTPEKRITLQVDMRKVDYFVIEGQKFVPQGDCFAALLYYSRFKKKSYFSLRSGRTDYVITSRSGFLKLFPTYKKQLKAYCRKERLDFKEDGGVRAMTRLTEYIDSLIHGK